MGPCFSPQCPQSWSTRASRLRRKRAPVYSPTQRRLRPAQRNRLTTVPQCIRNNDDQITEASSDASGRMESLHLTCMAYYYGSIARVIILLTSQYSCIKNAESTRKPKRF